MSDALSREQVKHYETIMRMYPGTTDARNAMHAVCASHEALLTRLEEQTRSRQQDALDGQAALDLLNQQVADLTAKLEAAEQERDEARLHHHGECRIARAYYEEMKVFERNLAAAQAEAGQWKLRWELRGKALARPCMQCGYVQKEIKSATPPVTDHVVDANKMVAP